MSPIGFGRVAVLSSLTMAIVGGAMWPRGATTRVSVTGSGWQGNSDSTRASISADGRYVAFASDANNLVLGDNSVWGDVFVHDQLTGQTTRVSVSSSGGQANHNSLDPSISADGRYVAFDSRASNLVPGDTNGTSDVFVHDRQTGETTRVSVSSGGLLGNDSSNEPSISTGGRYVAFHSLATNLVQGDTNGSSDVFVHDRQTGETTLVSISSGGEHGNSESVQPTISADGRYVAFDSSATNLVQGDTNGSSDVFVHDRQTGETTRVSVSSSGGQGNSESVQTSISADGRYVAFFSSATNLVQGDTNGTPDVFVHDRQVGETTRVSVSSSGGQGNDWSRGPSISAEGRYVAFGSNATNLVPGDTNETSDTFVHDRQTGQTTRVSLSSGGGQGNNNSGIPSISADGRHVALESLASNLVPGDTNGRSDVFVHDRQTAQTTRVSISSSGQQGNSDSVEPSISADGRYVAFYSYASNLAPGDTNDTWDVFVRDRRTGQTTRVSVSSSGGQGNYRSYYPSISADGRYVAFQSYANNLVQGDTNGYWDVFVHDLQTRQTTRVSVTSGGGQGNRDSVRPSISADGRYVAFHSFATNLVQGDTNGRDDVFVHDRQTGQTTRVSVSSSGGQANHNSLDPSISADGQYVAFVSRAFNLVQGDKNETDDVFMHDRQTGQTTLVSVSFSGGQGNSASYNPSISADGRYVAFYSVANNLVQGDTNDTWDVFVRDRQAGQTTRVSVSSSGQQGNSRSEYVSISADGRHVAFYSYASNLVQGDTNGWQDVFVHDRQTGQTTLASISSGGEQANERSYVPSISADGQHVVFDSWASNLVPGDTNGFFDVFVHQHFRPSVVGPR